MSYVQSKSTSTDLTAGTTLAVTLTANVTAGNQLIALIAADTTLGSNFVSGVAGGGTWTRIAGTYFSDGPEVNQSELWQCENSTGGAVTVTVTYTNSVGYRGLAVHEVAGLMTTGALDQATGRDNTGVTTVTTSPNASPVANGEYIFGASVYLTGSGNVLWTATSPFTLRESIPSGTALMIATEDYEQPTAATLTSSFGVSASGTYLTDIATFQVPAGPPPPPPDFIPTYLIPEWGWR